jgi:hypothetical protein
MAAREDDDAVVIEEGHRLWEIVQERLRHPRRGSIAPEKVPEGPVPVGVALHGEVVHVVLCSVGSAGPERICARLSIGRLFPALLVLAT